MVYALECDSCGYADSVDEERAAYVLARDHERDHGSHFVHIKTGP